MNSGNRRSFGLVAVSVLLACSVASATTITIDLEDPAAASGMWSAGDLIRLVITVESDGASNQGISLVDFKTGAYSLSVIDSTKLHVHDVLAGSNGTVQVDSEYWAGVFDGSDGYVKNDDTWAYDELADFLGSVDVSDTSFEAVANTPLDMGSGLGTDGEIGFLNLVLEVQPGFALNDTAGVQLYCEVAAYNTAKEDTSSVVFGSAGGAVNSGQFVVTNVPEPTTAVLVLAGLAGLIRRRRVYRTHLNNAFLTCKKTQLVVV
ncbi:MAG: PEP-CTERM sorting domain-containing protein [Phycisphaerae bacterium]